jgi:gamma-glutamyl hercynylcysteine S-oxide synthase
MNPFLRERWARARAQSDRLFAMVRPDSIYDRPIPERHRIIFYLGHLEAFDWNLLQGELGLKTLDASLDRLFAFGIDPVVGGLPSDQPGDWPSRPQVQDYSRRVRRGLELAVLERAVTGAVSDVLMNVAIEHRLMHVETLAYMLHQLPLDRKTRQPQAKVPAVPVPEAGMVEIPQGSATLGKVRSSGSFGWDNEFESHVVDTPAFAIDRHKITNGQFLEFVSAGGYRERGVWSEAGWNWIQRQGIEHPVFWRRKAEEWFLRTRFEEIPLPLHWPVYVSHAEASVYAAWSHKRLPTEAEWHRAAYGTPSGAERDYPWGQESPAPRHGYFDLERWDPGPVNAFPESRSAFGVEGMLANGWEWTASRFEPFSGFEPFSFYPGYSANFFDGLHYVLKGGSTRTEACMLRRSFRNWFQPHYQYVYAGFRCAV